MRLLSGDVDARAWAERLLRVWGVLREGYGELPGKDKMRREPAVAVGRVMCVPTEDGTQTCDEQRIG